MWDEAQGQLIWGELVFFIFIAANLFYAKGEVVLIQIAEQSDSNLYNQS